MKLSTLKIRNFKGIKDLDIDPAGLDVAIFGDNATGKTTIGDAIFWLLTNKDSLNNAEFEIKPLDENGEVQHGLESSVAATWITGAKDLTLKKVYREIWTKPRGKAERVFSGNTTDHFINDVPATKREYDDLIKDIADTHVFSLVTNPRYIGEVMHWEKCRELLLQVCGDVTDADVINSSPDLSDLSEILGDRKLEDHKKVVAARRTEINKELKKIPVRIDEASNGILTVTRDEAVIKTDKTVAETARKAKRDELNLLESGGEASVLKKQKAEVDADIAILESDLSSKKLAAESEKNTNVAAKKNALDSATSGVVKLKARLKELKDEEIPAKKIQKETLLSDYKKLKEFKFSFDQSGVCSQCGQDIPEEDMKKTEEADEKTFNEKKAKALADNVEKGKALAGVIKGMESEVDELNEKIETATTEMEELTKDHDAAKLKDIDIEEPAELATLKEKLEEINASISGLGNTNADAIEKLKAGIQAYDGEIETLNTELLHIKENERIENRIEELGNDEKGLSAEFERLEHELNLMDTFTRTKVEMLDERINSKFKVARFRLFKEQVNGGIDPRCDITVNGVPYKSLNNAMKINSGLDICETIATHYKVSLPVVIDNAEAVTDLYKTTAQQIRLVVTPGQKELLVKTEAVDQAA